MHPLFRIEKSPDADDQLKLLGYDWIEVLAIEPWALGHPGDRYGEWAYKTISNYYICLTSNGLMRIVSEDFWAALEEYGEYNSNLPESAPAAFTVVAGSLNIRQVETRSFIHNQHRGATHMGDSYNVGQAGAVGKHAHADNNTFQQVSLGRESNIDLAVLAQELERLRSTMRAEGSTAEQDIALGEVTQAQLAAAEGDGPRAFSHLKQAGSWALATATAIGTQVAAAAIKGAVGL